MFRQSITGQLLLRLKNALMQYNTSVAYQWIMRIADKIGEVFYASATHRYFTTPTTTEQYKESSLFYKCIVRSCEFIATIFTALRKGVSALLGNGLLGTTVRKLNARGFLNPEYLCALFLALMLLVPHTYWNNLYAFGGAVLLLSLGLLQRAKKDGCAEKIYTIPVSFFVFIVAIALGMLITPVRSDGVRIALFYATSLIFMLLCALGIRTSKALYTFINILIGALGILCVFGIVQRFLGVEVNPEFTDIANNKGMPGRVFATMSNPNNFAEVIVLLMPFAGALLMNAKTNRIKLLWAGVLVLGLIALAMSYSRSCYVAFAIALAVFFALYDWRLLLPLGLLAVMCLPILPDSIMNRISTIGSMKDTSNASRVYIWIGVLDMLRDHIVTGIGLGPQAFTRTHALYALAGAPKVQHAHMLYLEIFSEMGILGGFSFLVFIFSALKRGFARVQKTDPALRNIIIAGIASLGGISFVGAAEYIWFYPRVMFVFWVVVGILLCAIRLAGKDEDKNE